MGRSEVIFDFDGVLIDSLDEVIVTSYNTVFRAEAHRLEDLPASFAGFMRLNRCRARSAGEIALLADWAKRREGCLPAGILTAEEFSAAAEEGAQELGPLEERFFAARRRFAASHPQQWLALNRPYQPLWRALQEGLVGQVRIVTYKNAEAVLELCRHYGLGVLPESVHATLGLASKRKHLARLIQELHGAEVYYVDDSLRSLRELKASLPALRLLWAAWGYGAPEEEENAKALSIPSVGQDELIRIVGRR